MTSNTQNQVVCCNHSITAASQIAGASFEEVPRECGLAGCSRKPKPPVTACRITARRLKSISMFPISVCARSFIEMSSNPHRLCLVRSGLRGRFMWAGADWNRAMLQVSQGGPPKTPATDPAAMKRYHIACCRGSARLHLLASIATSTEATVSIVPAGIDNSSSLDCRSPLLLRPLNKWSTISSCGRKDLTTGSVGKNVTFRRSSSVARKVLSSVECWDVQVGLWDLAAMPEPASQLVEFSGRLHPQKHWAN